ncbi:MAG: ribonuclease PH [Candidatus Omnitrophica bacterium]|nr:ribonuclease PH [Candidatus Omnitrophota bacterium]
MRPDGRKSTELRQVKITPHYMKNAHGSCLIEMGDTKVLCSATMEPKVPPFMKGSGKGWVSAEYGMLPASCNERIARESSKGKVSGRTMEIQRLIGRSLRSVTDMTKFGERTLWIDADVIQGDGGTRTASITGGFIALSLAFQKLKKDGLITENPLKDYVAAVSVGIVNGKPVLDLCYLEDSKAEVDMNIIMTSAGKFVEVQGTAEGEPFNQSQLDDLLQLAKKGIQSLIKMQKQILK